MRIKVWCADQGQGGRASVRGFPTAGLYGELSYHQQCERQQRQLREQKALWHAIAKYRRLEEKEETELS